MAKAKTRKQQNETPDTASEIRHKAPSLIETIKASAAHDEPLPNFGIHVDLKLDIDQANALRRLATVLDNSKATTAKGRRVTDCHGALRWLLDEMAANHAE